MAISNTNTDINYNIESIDADILDSECDKEIKILVMGEIDSGKSSLIKIFFGDNTPQIVLANMSEPTIGAEISVFEKNNSKIGVFDLAGQEFGQWLSPSNSEMFIETDGIFLLYSLSTNLKKKEIERTSKKIRQLLRESSPKCEVTIILNKYDEFLKSKNGSLKKANLIKTMVEEASGFTTYISALTPNYYPLLRLKLDRIIGQMPLESISVAITPENRIINPPLAPQLDKEGYLVKGIQLAEAKQIFEEDYDERISRLELMNSEFSLGR